LRLADRQGHDIAALLCCRGRRQRRIGWLYRPALGRDIGLRRLAGSAADKLLMLLCFGALFFIGMTPMWLVALVVARDLAIACGWLAIKLFSLSIATQPLFIGKASTLVQVLYIFAALFLLAFDLSAPRLTQLAAWACGLLTVLSAVAYGGFSCAGF